MNFLLFIGTARDSSPPNPPRLGVHVANACARYFEDNRQDHTIELIDPLDYDSGAVFKPHFSYAKNKAPAGLQTLAEKIEAADGYIMVSPEYNHAMSPVLAHLLNHFGSSLFSYKPSVIVTYSAGQWGGMRAAVGMRSFLGELGCLPVSAMIHVPKAQEIFAQDGSVLDGVDQARWNDYFARAFAQLCWWGEATKNHRSQIDPGDIIKAFKKDPSQRNAP